MGFFTGGVSNHGGNGKTNGGSVATVAEVDKSGGQNSNSNLNPNTANCRSRGGKGKTNGVSRKGKSNSNKNGTSSGKLKQGNMYFFCGVVF